MFYVSCEMGGLVLSYVVKVIVFEEVGYLLLGLVVLNIYVLDEGNIYLMDVVVIEVQKDCWLCLLVQGYVCFCFVMIEFVLGFGLDFLMLCIIVICDGDDYLINGCKWLIIGVEGVDFGIVMVCMEDGMVIMFLIDMKCDGIIYECQLDLLDSCFIGGYGQLCFDNLCILVSDVFGEIGKGFWYVQVCLVLVWFIYCMCWLGVVCCVYDIVCDYVCICDVFGKLLGEYQGVGFMLVDNMMDLYVVCLVVWYCVWVFDQGWWVNVDFSMVKVISVEVLWWVVDCCVQVLGGCGVIGDIVVEWIFCDICLFCIYDGLSEVYCMSLVKKLFDQCLEVC